MSIKIRAPLPSDYDNIDTLMLDLFETDAEMRLVRAIRKDLATAIERIAVDDDNNELLGFILFSPLGMTQEPAPKLAALAPMGVALEHQQIGIGKALVHAGIKACKQAGYTGIAVLGHADYYPKFGFTLASGFGLRCPYDVPKEIWMALELVPHALDKLTGTAVYPRAFHLL